MNCPVCSQDSSVLKSRGVERRRQCTICGHRFTTIEKLKDAEQRQQEAVQVVREAAERLKDAA